MNITLDKKDNVEAVINVNVDVADYADKVKAELKKIAQNNVIPGFRKGHVPMDQLRRRFGKGVKSDVINDLVYREVIKYLKDNNINILGEPLPIDVKEIGLNDEDYTFSYEIGLAPDFGIKVDKDITLPFYTIEVTDEMRKEQDENLRERLATQGPGETVEGRALVKGAIMELNSDGSPRTDENAILVENGIVAPFTFKNKEEADKFMGKHVGDKIVFNPWATCEGNAVELSSMLDIDKEKATDVKSDFELAISEIIVATPAEHNQEFFDNVFGKDKVHNEEEYEKALTSLIAQSLVSNSQNLFANEAHEYFVNKCKNAELPVEFLKKWLKATNKELTDENIDEEFAKMHDSLIWELVSSEIARQLDVKVTEEDLLNYAKGMAYQQFAQYGMTNMDDETLATYAKHILENKDYRRQIFNTVENGKLFSAIHDAVTIDQKEVTLDEFKKLATSGEKEE